MDMIQKAVWRRNSLVVAPLAIQRRNCGLEKGYPDHALAAGVAATSDLTSWPNALVGNFLL